MSAAAELERLAQDEVLALHAFVAWFRDDGGRAADFALCEGALAPDFRMVSPEGEALGRADVLARIREARGALDADFRIEIADLRPVWAGADAVLLEYVERQYRDGRTTRRRSTGLMTGCGSAPRGVHWRHLQETWMDAA